MNMVRFRRAILVFLVLLLSVPLAVAPERAKASSTGLTVNAEGVLYRKGAPYRGIGINYFSAFLSVLEDHRNRTYEDEFRNLKALGIPFIRLPLLGLWAKENREYLANREKYFELLDQFVAVAEREDIGLIPTLFWSFSSVPDMMGEPLDAWADTSSKTHRFMQEFTAEVVTRYRGSPAIWAWEFGNEINLRVDRSDSLARPSVRPEMGTPARRTSRDNFTSQAFITALVEFGKTVRALDAERLLSSGNAIPRPESIAESASPGWDRGARASYSRLLVGHNPSPINSLSVHLYPEFETRYESLFGVRMRQLIEDAMKTAKATKKPLVALEFGVPSLSNGAGSDAREKQTFDNLLHDIEQLEVPLSALWVLDPENRFKKFNVSLRSNRGYQLQAISEANDRLRQVLR